MSLKIFTLITFIIVLLSFNINAQASENVLKTKYSYTLSSIASVDQLDHIKTEIESLEFVEKVKLNIKDESSGNGQLIIFINEPKRTTESQIMFQPSKLKELIFIDNINLID